MAEAKDLRKNTRRRINTDKTIAEVVNLEALTKRVTRSLIINTSKKKERNPTKRNNTISQEKKDNLSLKRKSNLKSKQKNLSRHKILRVKQCRENQSSRTGLLLFPLIEVL